METFKLSIDVGDGIVVRAFQIITTSEVVVEAWEKTGSAVSHSTMFRDEEHGWLGRVGTKQLPQEIRDMRPASDERIAAVDRLRDRDAQVALDAIERAIPGIGDIASVAPLGQRRSEMFVDVQAIRSLVLRNSRSAA